MGVQAARGPERARPWVIAAMVVTGAALAGWTLLLGLAAQGVRLPGLAGTMTRTDSIGAAATYLMVLALFLATVVAFRRRRRTVTHDVSHLLTLVGIVAAVAAVLGLVSYGRCQADIPVLYEVYWTLLMFVGIARTHGEHLVCTGIPSLAFEIGRVLALTAVFGGAAAALTVVVRGPYSKGRLALDPAAQIFVGVDGQSLPLVAEALADPERSGGVYVVDPDPGSPVVAAATALGAVHVEGFGEEPELLRRALRRRWPQRGIGLREFACLSADTDANLRFLDAFVAAVDEQIPPGHPTTAPRVSVRVRIDDIHRGERWWRREAQKMSFLHRPYTVDRIGLYDATARRIVIAMTARAVGRPAVVVDGDTAIAMAVVKHVAMEANWTAALHDRHAEVDVLQPHIVLTGERAPEVSRDALALWDLSGVTLSVQPDVTPWEVDRDALRVDCLFAVLTHDARSGMLHGERVADRLYAKGVWVVETAGAPVELVEWVTTSPGMDPWERGDGVVRVQPLVLAQSGLDQQSTWEQAAWHVAQFDRPGHHEDADRHLRDVIAVGTVVRDAGLVWGPAHRAWRAGLCCDSAAAGGPHEPGCLFAALCARQDGGPEAAATGLGNVLTSLRILGLSPWFQVRRVGTIARADRLTETVSLDTNRGVQNGVAGDWLITDSGSRWVVSHEGFAASFDVRPPFLDHYTDLRRVGQGMWARRAVPGETVAARGAVSVAAEGDWVLREENISWVALRATFEKGYAFAAPPTRDPQ